jgi:hypothetical protein
LNSKPLPVVPIKYQECLIYGVSVNRILLHVFLVIAACAPLVALVADMVQRYPLDRALMDITLIDAVLLIAATSLPVFVLSRLGVDWRSDPEEY